MANPKHLEILKQGVEVWNKWREENPDIIPDLSKTNLSRTTNIKLKGANFNGTKLTKANLEWAYLKQTNFINANLCEASVINAYLSGAKLIGAKLKRACLSRVNFFKADLTKADLTGAALSGASLVNTIIQQAIFRGSFVYGISAWNVIGVPKDQTNLVITPHNEPEITVDDLEVAQFVFMLIHNQKIRNVIDTIGKKAVLILGRFTPERKAVLDALREELRRHDYIPILFDFEKPASRDLTETVSTLAHLSRFIIADLTDARSIPHELQAIVPNLPSVAVQPIINISDREYVMVEHIKRYPWVLPVYRYQNQQELIRTLSEKVIQPLEEKVLELRIP